MSLRKSVVPAALALAGCLPTESERPPELGTVTYSTPEIGEACEVEPVVHHVRGEVVQAGASGSYARELKVDKSAVAQGTLVVTVSETSSVVSCTDDLVTLATPGAELASASYAASSTSFSLDVPSRVVGGMRSTLRIAALLDQNDNGFCDDGELSGEVVVDDTGLGALAIALSRDDCAFTE